MADEIERESIEFDVLFVGGGPANLAGAIRIMQQASEKGLELEVALIEKGAEVGAHSLSGAVMNPVALKELLPDYKERSCPIQQTVRGDQFMYLTQNGAFTSPMVPKQMHNKGFYIVSQSQLSRWMGEIAEEMGVNIFPGFTGKKVLYGQDGKTIIGVQTGDQGLDKDGKPKPNFEPGIDLKAKVTVFGEGARGSLMKEIAGKLDIFIDKLPQVFETGIKEVIQLPEDNYFTNNEANDIHTLGYPLGLNVPGGGFIYEMADNRVSIGYLIGLGYEDPELDLYDIFMDFKRHPKIAEIIKGGKVIEQGARTVSTGGLYSLPKLAVDGAVFVGGAAGIHNSPALKGIHTGMKSGMLAADAILEAIDRDDFSANSLTTYSQLLEESWVWREMREGRNFAQALAKKGLGKFIHLGAQYFSGGRGLIDRMSVEADCDTLKPFAGEYTGTPTITGKGPFDENLYLDKMTGVYLSKTMHREDQQSHLVVHDTELCINTCYPKYGCPCTRFCPAGVYEIDINEETGRPSLKLNPSNCLHCKTCDIKDPLNNITWTCPEGGEGPGYTLV